MTFRIAFATLSLLISFSGAAATSRDIQVSSTLEPGRCLQPDGGTAKVGVPLSVRACSAVPGQKQKVRFEHLNGGRFRIRLGGLCAAPTGGKYGNGTRLQLQTCSSSVHQRWIVSNHRLYAASQPTKVINLLTKNLTHVVIWNDTDGASQKWNFRDLVAGTTVPAPAPSLRAEYVANQAAPAKCIQPDRNVVAAGEKVSVKSCTDTQLQALSFARNADGSSPLIINGFCIAPTGASYANGTRLELQKCSGAIAQQWWLNDDASFSSVGQSGQIIDLNQGNRTDVILSAQGDSSSQHWTWTAALDSPGEFLTLGKVMPLGDSITLGLNDTGTLGGYRVLLEDLLQEGGFSFDFVGSETHGPASLADRNHEGHAGFRIDEIASNLDAWLASNPADTVLLMLGTNDILQSYFLDTAPARLMNLVAQIRTKRPAANIFVANLFPIKPDNATALDAFNASIRQELENRMRTDSRLFMVDMNSGFSVADDADPDGIHPTQNAYDEMAQRWLQALSAR